MCYNNNGDDMKRRLKKKPIIIISIILVTIIVLSIVLVKTINTINYHKTYEYKLLTVGYKIDEVKTIEELSDSTKDYILTLEYNKDVTNLIKEKYFMEKNLKKYLDYIKENDKNLTDVVAIINIGSDKDWYTDTKKADISKGTLMLVNKFYSLDDTYEVELSNVSNQYSFGSNQKLSKETFDAFLKMFNDAKKEDLTLIVNSSYRGYEEQKEIYDYYESIGGEEYANEIAAKPGFSEHQTGMAIDIQTYGSSAKTFETFEEFKWLSQNAHKYGFILRFPKDKTYLTGYEYESWHYRYVGVEAATYIYENNITFEEYYAYFIEKD